MSQEHQCSTLRLVIPQWQGGNLPEYHLGSRLLAWLAPETDDETIEVPISTEPTKDEKEDGIVAKQQLLNQTKAAFNILFQKQPDRVVVLGGDCSVELAPFAYLIEKYKGDLAILWIDGHPDITTTELASNYHAMVLASLLGEGDQDFASLVPKKVNPSNVIFAGINDEAEKERPVYQKFNFKNTTTTDFALSSKNVLEQIKETGVSHVAIHFDLDVMDMQEFRSLWQAQPEKYERNVREWPKGASMQSVARLIQDVAAEYDVVGLGITEHLPWDSYALSKMLSSLPLLKK
ncbi:arginase family protein [Bacillus paralicheniformis]|uniref:arginase family protein n=1 Tax=Bacillus paralicheniformis TaxID=1648923 RepID=UPI002E1F0A1F|nr:arginase family protein [Bacillus paralicheniformis]